MNSAIQKLAAITGTVSIANGIATLQDGTTIDLQAGQKCIVLVEIDCGAIHNVRSNMEARVVILDQDTEGGDKDRIMSINGQPVYVHNYELSEQNQNDIDPTAMQSVVSQMDEAQI